MKLWIVKLANPSKTDIDEATLMIVRADSARMAKVIAVRATKDERWTECEQLTEDGPAGVVLVRYT